MTVKSPGSPSRNFPAGTCRIKLRHFTAPVFVKQVCEKYFEKD